MTTYWWFRPSRIALFVAMPIAILAATSSNTFYRQFGAFNAITGDRFFPAWLSLLSFAGASWLGEILTTSQSQKPFVSISEGNYRLVMFSLAVVAFLATCVFLAPFALHPAIAMSALRGEPGAAYVVRDYVNQISGITSQENLFSVVIVLFMAKPILTGYSQTKVEKILLAVILAITALKVVLHTERLALIEIAIPLCLYMAALRPRAVSWTLAPLAGLVGLTAFFTGTEYLRSWVSFYAAKSDSLLDFAMDRMFGYYMTAINNGAFIYSEGHSYFFPIFTAGWLWRLPIPGWIDYLSSIINGKLDMVQLLSAQNIEFNNMSGVYSPLIDFGPVLGVIVWIALGYVSGRLFRKFAEKHCLGLILFPTWYVGVLELPRVFYWGDQRYFPPLLVSLIIIIFFLFLLPRRQQQSYSRGNIILSEHAHAPKATLDGVELSS